MTIIVSIHQPNHELLHMFDTIYVLAKGGANVYSGDPKDLKKYLSDCDINCKNLVPIEALLKHCHGDAIYKLSSIRIIKMNYWQE